MVPKDNGRNANGKHLPRRHDDGERDRSKLFDGVENAQLSRRRRNGRDDVVMKGHGIFAQEFRHHGHVARDDETRGGDANGRNVDAEHHLVRVDVGTAVLLVHFILPLTRKAVKANVHEQKDQANDFGRGVLVGRFAQDRKDGHPRRDERRFHVLRQRIRGAFQEFSHQHDGDDFARFEDGLHGKGHVLERGVLTPTAHGVGEGARGKGPERRNVVGEKGAVFHSDGRQRDEDGEKAIGKDAKGGTGKLPVGGVLRGLKGCRHDQFLHVTPSQVGGLETEKAEGEFAGGFEKFGVAVAILEKKGVKEAMLRFVISKCGTRVDQEWFDLAVVRCGGKQHKEARRFRVRMGRFARVIVSLWIYVECGSMLAYGPFILFRSVFHSAN